MLLYLFLMILWVISANIPPPHQLLLDQVTRGHPGRRQGQIHSLDEYDFNTAQNHVYPLWFS